MVLSEHVVVTVKLSVHLTLGRYHMCKKSADVSMLASGFPQLRSCHIPANLISNTDFYSQTR